MNQFRAAAGCGCKGAQDHGAVGKRRVGGGKDGVPLAGINTAIGHPDGLPRLGEKVVGEPFAEEAFFLNENVAEVRAAPEIVGNAQVFMVRSESGTEVWTVRLVHVAAKALEICGAKLHLFFEARGERGIGIHGEKRPAAGKDATVLAGIGVAWQSDRDR